MNPAMTRALAGLLVGLGVAVFAKTVSQYGLSHGLKIGYIMGPGLVLAGLVRLKMQHMMDGGARRAKRPHGGVDIVEVPRHRPKGGEDDGDAS